MLPFKEKNKQAVILFDEFQEIGQMAEGKAIEGAIRHAGQDTQKLSFIFSGSNPHVLNCMFEDERRPLYKLCRKLILGRIDAIHYKNHLNKAAKAMWNQHLSEEIFTLIMTLSERHSYYLNYLCDILWSECESIPSIEQVHLAWQDMVEEEKSDLLKDFFRLSENQRKVLIHIANGKSDNLYSNETAKYMDIPASSISRALSSLIEDDYIEKTETGYHLIVPVYKTLLSY